jgi:Lon protease-like protein
MASLVRDFPLFPLGLVALPSELVPLHIFEERYKTMMARVLEEEGEFGIVWVSDDGLRPVGCACEVAEVLQRLPDGRLNLVARGTRVFRIENRQEELAYPAGTVEFLEDRSEDVDVDAAAEAHAIYAELVEQATDRKPDPDELAAMSAYQMAATVEFGLEAKQGLLDLRSESARLRLVTRLFRGALKRLDFIERAQARARSNGKVHFGGGPSALDAADPLRDVRGERREPLERTRNPRRPVREGERAALHADPVGQHGSGPRRERDAQLRLRLEVALELTRGEEASRVERMLRAVAADAPSVRDEQLQVGVAVGAAALDHEQVGRRAPAAGEDRGGEDGEPHRGPPHTTTSRASPISRRKRGVESTPSSCASTSARATPVVSTAAAHAQIRHSGSSAAVSRSSASERAKVSRPGAESAGVSSGRRARAATRGSRRGASASNVTRPRAGSPSAAVDTSSESPV